MQGYRDAQCAWLMLPQRPRQTPAASPAEAQPADTKAAADPASPAAVHCAKRVKQELCASPADAEVNFSHTARNLNNHLMP